MSECCWELVTTDEPAVFTKPFFNAIVVEDSERDGCFPDPTRANESDGREVLGETNDLVDQLVASETGPWWRGRRLSKSCARCKRKVLDVFIVKTADLFWAWASKYPLVANGLNVTCAYRANLTANFLPDLRHVVADLRNCYMGIHNQLCLKGND